MVRVRGICWFISFAAIHHHRPGKSCESSSSGKFRALQCPQYSVIRDKLRIEIRVSNVGVALSNHQVLSVYPQSTLLHPQFWILNPPFSILNPPTSNHFYPTSILHLHIFIFPYSVKSTGHLAQKVLKIIAWFPTKCPQAPLTPLAAFPRSGTMTQCTTYKA